MTQKTTQNGLSDMSQKQAAQLLGRTTRWLRDSSAPRDERGRYNAAKLVAWFVASQAPSDVGGHRERREAAMADMAEIRRDKMRGTLVEVNDVKECFEIVGTRLGVAIQRLDRINVECGEIVRDELQQSQQVFYDTFPAARDGDHASR